MTEEAEELTTRQFYLEAACDADLLSLFEAARWAPSAFNEQPWRFIYSRKGSEGYDKIFNALLPMNQVWAVNAPVLVLVVVKLNSSHNEHVNRHAAHDLGLAMGNFSAQATHLGLNLHQMGGFKQQEAQEAFHIPAGYEAMTITSVGYLGSEDFLSEALQQREHAPRVRKELSEFAFENEWKQ
ncbi:MAG: nitroreductase family protein [Bacteroidota bacterium]